MRIAIQWTENGPTEYFKITFAVTGIEPKVVTSTPVESPDIELTPEPETPDDSSRNEKGDGDYTSDAAPAAPAAPVTPAAPETPAASEPATETVGDTTTTKTEAEATFADGQVTFTTSQMGEYVIGTKYSQRSREEVKRRREKMACGEAEDAGGLAPAKDDNEAARFFIRRTLPILDCVDYKANSD